MKVSIIGVGRVGAALGLVLVARHLIDELVLVGRRAEATRAEALDLSHATVFGRPTTVRAGDVEATAGSDILVLCFDAGGPFVSRSANGSANYETCRTLLPALAAASPDAVLLVTTNPVDALTTLAGPLTGFPPHRVIGTGTLLDTMRLRSLLSERLGLHAADIRAYVLGEHGESQFVAYSSASVGGGRLDLSREEQSRLASVTRALGHQIARGKGHTNHGIALAAAEVIESIVQDSRQVMPLSVLVDGFAGVSGVCLSLPVVIGRAGVVRRIEVDLNADERAAFARSAVVVTAQVRELLDGVSVLQPHQIEPLPKVTNARPCDPAAAPVHQR